MFGCCEIPFRSFFTGIELEIVGMIELEAYRGIEGVEDDQEVVDDIPQATNTSSNSPNNQLLLFRWFHISLSICLIIFFVF